MASAPIQIRRAGRSGRSLNHQIPVNTTANGANVSFARAPGTAQRARRYQRCDNKDHTERARKNASPESTYTARFQFATAKLKRKSIAPTSDVTNANPHRRPIAIIAIAVDAVS